MTEFIKNNTWCAYLFIYLFGVKFAYIEQVCNIILDNKEEVIEKVNDIP